jgi:hypothetical protein
MKELGATHCNIVRVDVDHTTATRMALVLNRAGELGEWNETLVEQLQALKVDGFDLSGLGFDDHEFESLLATLSPDLPAEATGKEYDESVADTVKMQKCPHCGHEFPS